MIFGNHLTITVDLCLYHKPLFNGVLPVKKSFKTIFNLVLFIIVATIVAGVALQLLGLAAGYAIGEATGSNALGFTIMGILFLIVVLVLYLRRKKLFVNQLVRLFIKLFFDNGQK